MNLGEFLSASLSALSSAVPADLMREAVEVLYGETAHPRRATVRELIESLRHRLGVTDAEFADLLGVGRSSIFQYLRGGRTPHRPEAGDSRIARTARNERVLRCIYALGITGYQLEAISRLAGHSHNNDRANGAGAVHVGIWRWVVDIVERLYEEPSKFDPVLAKHPHTGFWQGLTCNQLHFAAVLWQHPQIGIVLRKCVPVVLDGSGNLRAELERGITSWFNSTLAEELAWIRQAASESPSSDPGSNHASGVLDFVTRQLDSHSQQEFREDSRKQARFMLGVVERDDMRPYAEYFLKCGRLPEDFVYVADRRESTFVKWLVALRARSMGFVPLCAATPTDILPPGSKLAESFQEMARNFSILGESPTSDVIERARLNLRDLERRASNCRPPAPQLRDELARELAVVRLAIDSGILETLREQPPSTARQNPRRTKAQVSRRPRHARPK